MYFYTGETFQGWEPRRPASSTYSVEGRLEHLHIGVCFEGNPSKIPMVTRGFISIDENQIVKLILLEGPSQLPLECLEANLY
jgi:hypothetical protein